MKKNNILETAVTLLGNIDEISFWDNRPFTGEWPKSKYDKAIEMKRVVKKKSKRARTAFTTDQLKSLERIFSQTKYITAERRKVISNALRIGDKSVKIWFQNRRMKEKRSSSESSDSSCDTSIESTPTPLSSSEINTEMTWLDSSSENYFPHSNYSSQAFCNQNQQFQQTFPIPSCSRGYGMQFYNDNNLYPTQYYPVNENYSSDYYYQNQQINAYDGYWVSNNDYQFY